MPTKFGNQFPAVRKGRERQRLMFFAVVVTALALTMILLVLVNVSTKNIEAKESPNQPESQSPQSALSSVALFAPTNSVAAGASLDTVQFREVYWPRHKVPEGAIMDRAELRAKFASRDLDGGLPITRTDLSNEPRLASLPITPGMRAISIQVDATSGIEGWARPGARVDVVLTHDREGELTTKLIAQNVRVLSAGGEAEGTEVAVRTTRVKAVQTVTLEVNQQDALTIMTARQLGKLSLLMRNPDDSKGSSVTEVDESGVSGVKKKKTQASCKGGTMRMGGKEYLVGCNGEITELMNLDEP